MLITNFEYFGSFVKINTGIFLFLKFIRENIKILYIRTQSLENFLIDSVMFYSGLFSKINTCKIFIYFSCFSFSMQQLFKNILFDTSRIFLKWFFLKSILFKFPLTYCSYLHWFWAWHLIIYSDQPPLPSHT